MPIKVYLTAPRLPPAIPGLSMPRYVLLAAVLLILTPEIFAQAWTPDAGKGTIRFDAAFLSADSQVDHLGEVIPYDQRLTETDDTPYRARNFVLSADVGLLDNVAVSVAIPLRHVSILDPLDAEITRRSITDLADMQLGVRMSIAEPVGLTEEHGLTVGLTLHMPLGYQRNIEPAVGSGQVNVDLVAAYGYRFDPIPAEVQAGLGYRLRTGMYARSVDANCSQNMFDEENAPRCFPNDVEMEYSDEVLGNISARYSPLGRLDLGLLVNMRWSIETPEESGPSTMVRPERTPRQRIVHFGADINVLLFEQTSFAIHWMTPVYSRSVLDLSYFGLGLQTRF